MISTSPSPSPTPIPPSTPMAWPTDPPPPTGAALPPPGEPPAPAEPPRPLPPFRPRPLAAVAVFGVLGDLSIRLAGPGVAVSLLVLAALAVVLSSRRPRGWVAHLATALVVAAATLLSVRSSVWTTWFSLLAAGALLAFLAADGCRAGRTRPVFDATAAALRGYVDLPRWLGDGRGHLAERTAGRAATWLRSATVGGVVFGVLGTLLASGDAAFQWAVSGLELGRGAGHLTLALLAAVPAGALAITAGTDSDVHHDPSAGRRAEALVALWAVVVALATWSGLQVAMALGGAERILADQDLTAAEYARQGFFQLVAVAAVSLAVLNAAYRHGTEERRADGRQRIPAVAIGALLAVLIVITYRRLGFYIDAFGLTMLRLSVAVFLAWLSTVTVLSVGRTVVQRERDPDRAWLATTAVLGAAVFAIAVGAADPEAYVARTNLDRAAEGAEVDVIYLGELSADATPILVDGLDDAYALSRRCDDATSFGYGPLGWNLALHRAAEACDGLAVTDG